MIFRDGEARRGGAVKRMDPMCNGKAKVAHHGNGIAKIGWTVYRTDKQR